MIKNKLIKTSLCALSLLSVFSTPMVYAEDGQSDTEQIMPADIITQDLKTVTLNYEVAETYEWNIHPAIDFGKNAGTNQTVSKKNNIVSVTKNVLRSGNKLVIKIKGGGNNNAFTISNGKNQVLDYVVNDGVNNLGVGDTILEIASGVSSSNKNLEFKLSTSKNNAEIAGSYNGIVGYTAELNGPVLINKTDRYVNFYADVDGNGTVDGVIFKDLVNGASQETISRMKNYTISEETYDGKFGTLPVLTPADTGEDRFYVMALENITGPNDFYTWYAGDYFNGYKDNGLPNYVINEMSDWETTTSPDFGKGKANTATMIDRWNSRAYGKQNNRNGYKDLWGVIQEQAIGGWFVPSSDEWTTFLNTFNVGYENFRKLGLSASYWTSTQSSEINVSMVGLFKKDQGYQIDYATPVVDYSVCLATTF